MHSKQLGGTYVDSGKGGLSVLLIQGITAIWNNKCIYKNWSKKMNKCKKERFHIIIWSG